MSSIILQNIDKAYGKNAPVIENLNLEIKDKSFTVLLGPSGCGKSTILRMIAGLEAQTSGTILFDDEDMTNVPPENRDIAFVFQNYALYPTMTVRGNIEFGLKNRKIPKRKLRPALKRYAHCLISPNISTANRKIFRAVSVRGLRLHAQWLKSRIYFLWTSLFPTLMQNFAIR